MNKLPIHLKPGAFMDIMKEAKDFDKNSLHYHLTYIALIDILGYKRLLEEFGVDAPKKLFEDILDAFSWAKTSHQSLTLSIFSDTIIIEGLDENPMNFWNIIQVLSSLRLQLLKKGLLVRGAITFGEHFSDKGVLISPALVEAHLLESKTAINPRIITSSKAIKKASRYLVSKKGIDGLIVDKYFCKVESRMISTDIDDLSIVVFDPNVVELRYLKYGEHPDMKNIDMHVPHCISAGNSTLKQISQGIAIAQERVNSKKEVSKVQYTINEWNSYLDTFKNKMDLHEDYKIKIV
jgi:hypothetical protein